MSWLNLIVESPTRGLINNLLTQSTSFIVLLIIESLLIIHTANNVTNAISISLPTNKQIDAHQLNYLNLVARSLIHQEVAQTTSPSISITTTTTATATVDGSNSQDAPNFEEPIGNHTVPVGRDAQLSCKISKLGNFRTAWLRVEDKGILTIHNNVITRNYRFGLLNNEDERNFILTIKNVQPTDKGGYMCQINSVPMKYAIGYLDVLTPPVFDDNLSNGDSSSPALDGGDVLNDSIVSGGEATASASAPVSSSSSTSSSNNGSQVTVRENTSATLSCRASGHPSPTITWRREDGRPILLDGIDSSMDASQIEIRDTNTLTFSSIHRTNSGAYLCIASNGVQPSASKRQLLDVQFSPIITLPQAEVSGHMGQAEARLECLVELNPLGSYHWIKLATTTLNTDRKPIVTNQEDDLWLIEHDELMQSDKFEIVIKQINSEKVQMILTLRHIEKQDFSWYKCVARNKLGLQSNFIRFYESSKPSLQAQPSSSFSFNSFFRTGAAQTPAPKFDDNNQPEPPNDEHENSLANNNRQLASNQARAHTRSSWIQRSTTNGAAGSVRSRAGSSALASTLVPITLSNVLKLFSIHCHQPPPIAAVVNILPYLVTLLMVIFNYGEFVPTR